MTQAPDRNHQFGEPVAQSTDDAGLVASAAARDGVHYEADADQIVKVVHQVRPATLPVEGPTDDGRRDAPVDPGLSSVAVTPQTASVWEAGGGDRDGSEVVDDGQEEVFSRTALARGEVEDPKALSPEDLARVPTSPGRLTTP